MQISKIKILITGIFLSVLAASSGIAQKTVALTFDDGPHPGVTEEIIKILKEKEVKATFFMVGKMVEKYPDIVQNVYSAGHEIGNHTYSDTRLTSMTPDQVRDALTSFNKILEDKIGRKTSYFRPPGGRYNKKVLDIADEKNLNIVMWTRLVKDTSKNISSKDIYNLATRSPAFREIILLHDGPQKTLKALPEIIDFYKSKGYKFRTVADLTPPIFRNTRVASGNRLFNVTGREDSRYLPIDNDSDKQQTASNTFAGILIFFGASGSLFFIYKVQDNLGGPRHEKVSLVVIGAGSRKIDLILQTLKGHSEKVAFFLSPYQLKKLNKKTRKILSDSNHSIALLKDGKNDAVKTVIESWQKVVEGLEHLVVPLAYSKESFKEDEIGELRKNNYFPVNWKIDPPTESMEDPEELGDYVLKKLQKSGVVPLYPQNISSGESLLNIFKQIELAGYSVVTLSDYLMERYAA